MTFSPEHTPHIDYSLTEDLFLDPDIREELDGTHIRFEGANIPNDGRSIVDTLSPQEAKKILAGIMHA